MFSIRSTFIPLSLFIISKSVITLKNLTILPSPQ